MLAAIIVIPSTLVSLFKLVLPQCILPFFAAARLCLLVPLLYLQQATHSACLLW